MGEVSVEFIKGEKYLSWYSDDNYTIKHMKKLAEEHDEVKVTQDFGDDGYGVLCPVGWFREPKPPIKRDLTDEQKEKARQRMKNMRNSN